MSRCYPTIVWLLFALMVFPAFTQACVWVNGTTLDGLPKWYTPKINVQWLTRAMKESPSGRLDQLIKSPDGSEAGKREGEAVRKIFAGDSPAAIRLLQAIEQDTPGQYSTAANLGTAYELAGDNNNALKWISEGIRRNPDSHWGTEWLHALILEAKMRLEKDPDYLKVHRIIPLPENFDSETKLNVGGAERKISEIVSALNYQLRERVLFVKPLDPVVADLMFTYALCEAHTGVVESAVELLNISKDYGFQNSALLEATLARYNAALWWGNAFRTTAILLVIIALLSVIPFLCYCYRRKWFFLSREAHLRYLESKKAAL